MAYRKKTFQLVPMDSAVSWRYFDKVLKEEKWPPNFIEIMTLKTQSLFPVTLYNPVRGYHFQYSAIFCNITCTNRLVVLIVNFSDAASRLMRIIEYRVEWHLVSFPSHEKPYGSAISSALKIEEKFEYNMIYSFQSRKKVHRTVQSFPNIPQSSITQPDSKRKQEMKEMQMYTWLFRSIQYAWHSPARLENWTIASSQKPRDKSRLIEQSFKDSAHSDGSRISMSMRVGFRRLHRGSTWWINYLLPTHISK